MGSSPTHDLDRLRARDEAAHARALAWFLDPREAHGFGDAFTRAFHRLALGRAPAHLNDVVVTLEPSPQAGGVGILVRSDADCLRVECSHRTGAVTDVPASTRLVLEPLDEAGGQTREGSGPPEIRTLRWTELVAGLQAACDDVRRHRPEADGLPALRAYIELVERDVIGRWRGFDAEALDPHAIAAASRYLTCKPRLLAELGRFCEAVQRAVGDREGWASRIGSEVQWADGVVLHALYYHPAVTAAARSLSLSLRFWTPATRPDHLELWLGAETRDGRLIDRWGSELGRAGHKRLFGAAAAFQARDGYAEIAELIPRECWYASGDAESRRAIAYCRDRLIHYLDVSSRAPVFPSPRVRHARRERASTAA